MMYVTPMTLFYVFVSYSIYETLCLSTFFFFSIKSTSYGYLTLKSKKQTPLSIVNYCQKKRHFRHKRHTSSIGATFIVTPCVTMIKDNSTVILFSFYMII